MQRRGCSHFWSTSLLKSVLFCPWASSFVVATLVFFSNTLSTLYSLYMVPVVSSTFTHCVVLD